MCLNEQSNYQFYVMRHDRLGAFTTFLVISTQNLFSLRGIVRAPERERTSSRAFFPVSGAFAVSKS